MCATVKVFPTEPPEGRVILYKNVSDLKDGQMMAWQRRTGMDPRRGEMRDKGSHLQNIVAFPWLNPQFGWGRMIRKEDRNLGEGSDFLGLEVHPNLSYRQWGFMEYHRLGRPCCELGFGRLLRNQAHCPWVLPLTAQEWWLDKTKRWKKMRAQER